MTQNKHAIDFKAAHAEIERIKPHLTGMGGSIRTNELGVIAKRNLKTIQTALAVCDALQKGDLSNNCLKELTNEWDSVGKRTIIQNVRAMATQLIKEKSDG